MTLKEILSAILCWSPVWSFPIQIFVSVFAAYEVATRKWPKKTIVFLCVFVFVMLALILCWYILPI